MKKTNHKILGAMILSLLLITGCSKEKVQEIKQKIQMKKEKKANDFSIYELSVYSADKKMRQNISTKTYYWIGEIKFDVNDDGIYSKKDGDYIYIDQHLLVNEEKVLSQLSKGKRVIYISSTDKRFDSIKSIVGIKDENNVLIVIRKPSETYSENFKDTQKMQELDQIFEEKYLGKGR